MQQSSNLFVILIGTAAALLLLAIILTAALARRGTGRSTQIETLAEHLFQSLSGRLDRIDELSRQVGEISNLFLVPRARGSVGEIFLNEYLANWLPKTSYETQYSFRNGARADAIIRLGGYLVPVDSKFPLESVKRAMAEPADALPADVRRAIARHMEDISSKYIQPAEGTLHFALMYIPSERIYYYLFVEHESDLLATALEKGVVPVSPANLFLYLQTIAYGLRGFVISRADRELVDSISQTQKEFDELKNLLGTAATHLRNFQKAFDDVNMRISRLELLIARLTRPGS